MTNQPDRQEIGSTRSLQVPKGALRSVLEIHPEISRRKRKDQYGWIIQRAKGMCDGESPFSASWLENVMRGDKAFDVTLLTLLADALGCNLQLLTVVAEHSSSESDSSNSSGHMSCLGIWGPSQRSAASMRGLARLASVAEGTVWICPPRVMQQLLQNLIKDWRIASKSRFIAASGLDSYLKSTDMLKLYERFARSNGVGDALLSFESISHLADNVFLCVHQNFAPLTHCLLRSPRRVSTPFGEFEISNLWYGPNNRQVFSAGASATNMALLSELAFWFKIDGFRYLSSQWSSIQHGNSATSRIVVFDPVVDEINLRNRMFWTLIYTFKAMGINVLFLRSGDFTAFTAKYDISDVGQIATAGAESLLTYNGEKLVSHKSSTAREIAEVQTDLMCHGPLVCFDEFSSMYLESVGLRDADMNKRGTKAVELFQKYCYLGADTRDCEIIRYNEEWKKIASK